MSADDAHTADLIPDSRVRDSEQPSQPDPADEGVAMIDHVEDEARAVRYVRL